MADPKETPFVAIPTPQPSVESLLVVVQALKLNVEILTNQIGTGQSRAVLKSEIP